MRGTVIGIIEDDKTHTALIEAVLIRSGYTPLTFDSTLDFRRRNGINGVDLILLDWNMPGESGLSFLHALRQDERLSVPVIFITANDRESQVVEALTAGADDYVVKPVRAAELVARIGSVLRRSQTTQMTHEDYPPFRFDPALRTVELHNELVNATPKEFDLMLFLFRRAGRVISRDSILAHVWRTRSVVPTRSIDTYISRLRKNFGLDGSNGWIIDGIYQHGYRLRETETPEE